DLAYRCGAGRLAQRATDELRATGARPRRASLTGLEALTPSERRVAELAAGGMSNPEIAQAVFVTLNTVEGHLRHVYQKLSVGSRTQLPAALQSAVPYPPVPDAPRHFHPCPARRGRAGSNITVPPWREHAAAQGHSSGWGLRGVAPSAACSSSRAQGDRRACSARPVGLPPGKWGALGASQRYGDRAAPGSQAT